MPMTRGESRTDGAACRLLALLFLLYVASMIDRQVIGVLLPQIKADLQVTDLQMSIVTGASFAVFYCLAGLPIGYAVDRYSRRAIIFIGVAIWSLATIGCGLATSFGHLAVARFLVGAGEAALSPAAYSLLADRFPERRLAVALSIFGMGATIGNAFSFFFGGLLLALLPPQGVTTPLGHLATWQAIFIMAALPAMLCAPLVLLFRETRRGGERKMPDTDGAGLWRFLTAHRGFFLPFFLGNGGLLLCSYAFASWIPTALTRRYGVAMSDVTMILALGAGISVPVGLLTVGTIIDRLFARGMRDAHMRMHALMGLGFAAAGLGFALAPSYGWAVVATLCLFFMLGVSSIAAAIPLTTPPLLRGRVSAAYLLVGNLAGIGLGPVIVAMFTDWVFHDEKMLHWAMACTLLIAGPLAALLLTAACRPMRRSVDALTASPKIWSIDTGRPVSDII